jgi:hypothetical protein
MNGSLRALAAVVAAGLLVSLAAANGPAPGFKDKGPGFGPGGLPGLKDKGDGKVIPDNMGKVMVKKKGQYATVFDPKATRTKLVIPKSLVTAAGNQKDNAKEGASAASGQTIMTGTALSLGLVTGGFWWMRRGKEGLGRGKTALLLVVGVVSFSMLGASTLFADLAFPGKDKKGALPGPGPGVGFGFGVQKQDIDIEVTEKGDTIYLVIPGAGFGNPFGPGGFNPGGPIGPGGPGGPGGIGFGGGFGGGGPGFKDNPFPKDAPPFPKDAPFPKDFPQLGKDNPFGKDNPLLKKDNNPPAKDNPFTKDNPFGK